MGIGNTRGVKADVGYARASTLGDLYRILGNPATSVEAQLAIARLDRGRLEHSTLARPRATPYDVTTTIPIAADAVADTFGGYVQLIAQGAYDFGDTPNCVQIKQLIVENMSANDVFIIEFYAFDGVITYEPLGCQRLVRLDVFTRSWVIEVPCRCFNIDDNSLVARLKSGGGGSNVTVSVSIMRMVHTDYYVPNSPGVWPTG